MVVLCYGSVDKMVSYLIGGVMVSLECVRSMGYSPILVKPKTIQLVFVASLLLKHAALRSKNKDWPARNRNIH